MKAIVEIPDRMLDIVRGLMMMQVDDEECEQEVNEAVKRLQEMKEPIELEMTGNNIVFGQDLTQEKKQMLAAIATFALCQVLTKMEDEQ